jgi:Trypsin-like peptidase domain
MELVEEFLNGLTVRQRQQYAEDRDAFQHAVIRFIGRLTDDERHCARLSAMEETLKQHTVMLAFSEQAATRAEDVCNNGTGSLVDTGAAKFLVTNYHVYNHFKDLQLNNPESRLMMSGANNINYINISTVDPVDTDDQRDLAVLKIPELTVRQLGKEFFKCATWPPPRPEEGMSVVVYGYPVEGREPHGDEMGARANLLGMTIWDVTNDLFTAIHHSDDVVRTTPQGAQPLTKLCGMSGGAVYVLREPEGLVLAGFMYKASKTMDQILATHAGHINADGTIRRRQVGATSPP